MDNWTPLLSACIGGLLATIPLLLGLIVQVGLHISENRRKDREAKTLLELELMRNDIRVVEETIDSYLRILEVVKGVAMTASEDKDEQKVVVKKLLAMFTTTTSEIYKLNQSTAVGERIAYSLGEEFYSEFKKFRRLYSDFHSLVISPSGLYSNDVMKLDYELTSIAGRCHALLRDKLISLRE